MKKIGPEQSTELRVRCLVAFIFWMLAPGCGWHAAGSPVEQAKKKWEAEGWKFLEVVGTPEPGAHEVSVASSETARSITALAFDGTERKRKEYFQTEARYLVVTLESASGHTGTLVFRRPKK